MKKSISVLLILLFIVSSILIFSSCDTTAENTENASECYNYLAEAHEICNNLLGDIYNAWHFAIYEADDCKSSGIIGEFLDTLKFYNDISTTPEKNKLSLAVHAKLNEMGASSYEFEYYLSDFNITTDLVIYIYRNDISRVNELLSSASNSLKGVSEKQDGYSTLKSYYLELKSCFDFCQSPDTSFEQLGTIKANFQKNLNTYKNELEFMFD